MNINKKITAFACAGMMALSLSSAAFAAPYNSGSFQSEHGIAGHSSEQVSGRHRDSHKRRSDHRRNRNESTGETPVNRDDRMPDSSYDEERSGRSHRPGRDRSSETQNPADVYALPGEVYTGDFPADPWSWYYEEYPVTEPEALLPEIFVESPSEKAPAEQLLDEAVLAAQAENETPVQKESKTPPETEQETAVQPEADAAMPTVDLNDEEAMQELFRAFLNWMRENYTISQ